jgi:hypothetical protein
VEDKEVDGEHSQDEAEKDAPGEDLLRVHKDIRGLPEGFPGAVPAAPAVSAEPLYP